MVDVFLLFILFLIVWFWWDSIWTKEIACRASKVACKNADVHMLDDTVEIKKLWWRRSEKGRLQICRLYFFDFISDGEYRYQGRIVVLGKVIAEIELDAYRIV